MNRKRVSGISYFFVHFAVEVLCFYVLINVFSVTKYWGEFALLFDVLAFFSQPFLGFFMEEHPKFQAGLTGGVCLMAGAAMTLIYKGNMPLCIAGLVVICLGNALVHLSGAVCTLRESEGRLTESALFVAGGSFGLVTGKLIGEYDSLLLVPFAVMAIAIVVIVVVDRYMKKKYGANVYDFSKNPCKHKLTKDRPFAAIIIVLALIVCVRAYIGYGIPTAWNTTAWQTLFLYFTMGLGKALGGILADKFGAGRVGVLSSILSIGFLVAGNSIMWLSLIGVALFSMTMAITLGGLVSVLPKNPGTAFGITTFALIVGTVPVFFYPIPSMVICCILICVLSLACAGGFCYCIKK